MCHLDTILGLNHKLTELCLENMTLNRLRRNQHSFHIQKNEETSSNSFGLLCFDYEEIKRRGKNHKYTKWFPLTLDFISLIFFVFSCLSHYWLSTRTFFIILAITYSFFIAVHKKCHWLNIHISNFLKLHIFRAFTLKFELHAWVRECLNSSVKFFFNFVKKTFQIVGMTNQC